MKVTYDRKIIIVIIVVAASIFPVLWYIQSMNNLHTNTTNSTTATSPANQTNPTPTQEFEEEIGNTIGGNLSSGVNTISIENPKQVVSIRFTAKYSGEATHVVFDGKVPQPQLMQVGLQEDNNGKPSGEWVDGGFGLTGPAGEGFKTVKLQDTVHITQGKVYHLVIKMVNSTVNDETFIYTLFGNAFAQPLNDKSPDKVWPDPKMETLFFDGKKWRQENSEPIFVIKYADGRSEGQPSSLGAPWLILDKVFVGQIIIPSSNYKLEKISFVVSMYGKPKNPLFYQMRDSSNNILAKGVFSTVVQLNPSPKWIEVKLDSPVVLKNGELYRIFIFSPETDHYNAFQLYGDEFSYDNNIGYGNVQEQLTISYDSGMTWLPWKDADAIFKLTVLKTGN